MIHEYEDNNYLTLISYNTYLHEKKLNNEHTHILNSNYALFISVKLVDITQKELQKI